MKEQPILFSAPMVLAILAGRKTVTRRIVNADTLRVRLPSRVDSDLPEFMPRVSAKPGTHRAKLNRGGAVTLSDLDLGVKPGEFHFECPYAVGDTHLGDYGGGRKAWTITPRGSQRLWVKETFAAERIGTGRGNDAKARVFYRASCPGDQATIAERGGISLIKIERWRPSIFMPRVFSRIDLEVVSVRIERLHDITESDAAAEGVEPMFVMDVASFVRGDAVPESTYRNGFEHVWREINGADSWKANPWIWRVEFRRIEESR